MPTAAARGYNPRPFFMSADRSVPLSPAARLAAESCTPERVKRLLVDELRLGRDPASIADDEPLFGGGLGLDSIDALELVVALERVFAISIPSEDVGREAFATAATLAAFVTERRALGWA
jgi:acyl carrier protein